MRHLKVFESFLDKSFTMYSGITKDAWDKIWKDKNLIDRETNVTSDIDFASNYSYNFKTGKYEDLAIEIENIPLEAFIAYRDDEYTDDDDFNHMTELSDDAKRAIINSYSIFLVDLYQFKDLLKIKLISTK